MNNLPRKKLVEKTIAKVRAEYGIQGKFTKADFYRICETENIELLNSEESRKRLFELWEIKGMLIACGNRRFVYLRSFFAKRFDYFTAMHELGHFFMNHITGFRTSETTRDSMFEPDKKKESEADYFAELALEKEAR